MNGISSKNKTTLGMKAYFVLMTLNYAMAFPQEHKVQGKLLTASYKEYSQRGHEVKFAQWNFLWKQKKKSLKKHHRIKIL